MNVKSSMKNWITTHQIILRKVLLMVWEVKDKLVIC